MRRRLAVLAHTPRAVMVAILLLFLFLVVLGSLLSSVPLYLVGYAGTIGTYVAACILTDLNSPGR